MIILLYIGHTQSTRYRLDSYVKTPQEYKTALIYHSENWVITNLSTSTSFNTLQKKMWRKGKLPSSHFVCLFYLPPALVTKAHIISAKYAALPKQSIAATLPWKATKVCSSFLLPPFLIIPLLDFLFGKPKCWYSCDLIQTRKPPQTLCFQSPSCFIW